MVGAVRDHYTSMRQSFAFSSFVSVITMFYRPVQSCAPWVKLLILISEPS